MVKFNAALNRLPNWTAAPGQDFPARGTVDVTTGLDAAQDAFDRCAAGEAAVGFGEIYVQTVHDPSPAPPASTCSPCSASTRPTTSTGTTAARRWPSSSST